LYNRSPAPVYRGCCYCNSHLISFVTRYSGCVVYSVHSTHHLFRFRHSCNFDCFCWSPVCSPVLSTCSVSFDSSPTLASPHCYYSSCSLLWGSPNPNSKSNSISSISPQSTPVTVMAKIAIRVRMFFLDSAHFHHGCSKVFCRLIEGDF
jgi:hypothetical protein